jgi:hypothetical protein
VNRTYGAYLLLQQVERAAWRAAADFAACRQQQPRYLALQQVLLASELCWNESIFTNSVRLFLFFFYSLTPPSTRSGRDDGASTLMTDTSSFEIGVK